MDQCCSECSTYVTRCRTITRICFFFTLGRKGCGSLEQLNQQSVQIHAVTLLKLVLKFEPFSCLKLLNALHWVLQLSTSSASIAAPPPPPPPPPQQQQQQPQQQQQQPQQQQQRRAVVGSRMKISKTA
jgi:hypothetical protein